ncbi:MAG: prepilin-type N-terminal cleavage/methylation domain-containing protein [Fimbriimonadaceae bacterium]
MTHRRGYTLIELSAVIVVLALLAVLITPNLGRSLVANQRRGYRAGVLRLIEDAKMRAAQLGTTITLRSGENGGFQLSSRNTDGEETVLQSLDAVDGIETSGLFLKDGTENGSDWAVNFYPDGSCDGGSIDLAENGSEIRYQIKPATGMVAIVSTDTEIQEDRWQAGEFTSGG